MCFMSTCLMLKVLALYKDGMVGWTLLGTFRSEFDVEYEDDLRISIQLGSQSPYPSLLLTR